MSMARTSGLTIALLLMASVTMAATFSSEERVTNADGKTIAVVIACNQCRDAGGKPSAKCVQGTGEGFWGGAACGQCLLTSNFGKIIRFSTDLHLTGYLKDADGKPLANQFIKLNLPNTWTVTTRTAADGRFRFAMAATEQPRTGKGPLVRDLGTLTAKPTTERNEAFQLYMLPEDFKACSDGPPKSKSKP